METQPPRFSIVVPARDEERWIGGCLDSIERAASAVPGAVEVVVVLNRCTDRTEEIARSRGAVLVREDAANLARIRNVGARAARGRILVTVDADSRLSPSFLIEVNRAIATERWVGGGVMIRMERYSLGLILTALALAPWLLLLRVSGGAFWLLREDFEAVGGFDEGRLSFEDVDFARRLRRHGRATGRGFKTLLRAWITTSARKFDELGDWFLLTHPWVVVRFLRGASRQEADRFWYEARRDTPIPGEGSVGSEPSTWAFRRRAS